MTVLPESQAAAAAPEFSDAAAEQSRAPSAIAAGAAAAPHLVIEAGRKWALPDALREMAAHRELLYFLTWRDVKVRYKQTLLGAGWAILQPFLTMVVFTLLFGRLAKIPSDGIPYPIFVYAGLLPWLFFSNSVSSSSNSLVGNANLITKVYFPRMAIPAAAVCAALVDLLIATVILVLMMMYYGVAAGPGIAMFPVLVALTALAAVAIGMWASALNVRYRDVRYALPFFIQILMYATPVIYPITFVPRRWRWLLLFNPLTGLIEGFRSALLGRPFEWNALAVSAALTLALLLYAVWAFRRMEREFADIV